jgi:transcriptional regulator with XRE-family HTH domain
VPSRPRGTAVIHKRLGTELRKIREDRRLRLDQVADELQVSPSTVSRLETAHTMPKVWEVRALAAFYQVDPEVETRLIEWATALKAGEWWRPITKSLKDDVQYLVALEAESAEIHNHCIPVLYGLLQSPAYARAVIAKMLAGADEEALEEFVELRLRRQELITRSDDPVRLHVIADEACLRRRMASPDVMHRQLTALLERSELENVTLQVVGFEQDFHRAAVCAFTIYIPRLPDVDPQVVSLERIDQEVFEEANPDLYADSFTSLSQHAMDQAASRKMIERIRRELTPAAH